MLSVQNECWNTNTLRGVNKQTDREVEQRQTEILGWAVFVFLWKSLFLLFWKGTTNLIECSFKIAAWYGDIFGTLCCALRDGWHGRRERLGFAEKEIEKKQNTRSQISWNNSCDRNGNGEAAQKPRMIFLLAQRKKTQKKTNISGP